MIVGAIGLRRGLIHVAPVPHGEISRRASGLVDPGPSGRIAGPSPSGRTGRGTIARAIRPPSPGSLRGRATARPRPLARRSRLAAKAASLAAEAGNGETSLTAIDREDPNPSGRIEDRSRNGAIVRKAIGPRDRSLRGRTGARNRSGATSRRAIGRADRSRSGSNVIRERPAPIHADPAPNGRTSRGTIGLLDRNPHGGIGRRAIDRVDRSRSGGTNHAHRALMVRSRTALRGATRLNARTGEVVTGGPGVSTRIRAIGSRCRATSSARASSRTSAAIVRIQSPRRRTRSDRAHRPAAAAAGSDGGAA